MEGNVIKFFWAYQAVAGVLTLCLWQPALAKEVTTSCFGKETAATTVVYLHGLDTPNPSSQEVENRKLLKQIAEELGFRLAVARSSFMCKSKVCWPQKSPEEHKKTYLALVKAVQPCLTKHTKNWGLLGFSNGGYFASKVAQYCYLDGPSWVIASGSAGTWSHTFQGKTKACPKLAIMIGQEDITRAKAKRYATYLLSAGFDIDFSLFSGKHELQKGPLVTKLKKKITP